MLKRIVKWFRDQAERRRRWRKELEQQAGVWDPHPLVLRKELSGLFAIVPRGTITLSHDLSTRHCKLPARLRLYTVKPPETGRGYVCIPVCCELHYIYSIPSKSVLAGCHGRYTLETARRFAYKYGGDPMCGGGIKNRFAPKLTEWAEARKLSDMLKSGHFTGYTTMHQCGSNWFDTHCYVGQKSPYFVYLYAGNPRDVMRYLLYRAPPPLDNDSWTHKTFHNMKEGLRQALESGHNLLCAPETHINALDLRVSEIGVEFVR